MRITKDAIAGTLESSDVMVRVAPHPDKLEVAVTSTVMAQFGDAIRAVVEETLARMGVEDGDITIEDKGALDCTIRARLQAAVLRGSDRDELDWSTL